MNLADREMDDFHVMSVYTTSRKLAELEETNRQLAALIADDRRLFAHLISNERKARDRFRRDSDRSGDPLEAWNLRVAADRCDAAARRLLQAFRERMR